ncbi:conserved exported hypothetical protein [Xanthomonas phaseoli pv. phaseoli]|uniref:MFS transporter n=1 Tax=Xanthomonas campestris pv. phaseoli TaxID=317013 RepID=A0AB38E697_XANCH|nr:conserved exported hypothetical protein [Xanthomonas phaseoli pv. phaseoli]SON91470.1 conserved exported hypothetical protein [Xanthomonas phaseoli pv. phaseoli]SON92944.1 conserved exported hypothetical protein [Xanthomonas phaseoli pv. phaseoli]
MQLRRPSILRHPVVALVNGMFAAGGCWLAPLPLVYPMVTTGEWSVSRVPFAVLFAVLGPLTGRVIARTTLTNWRNRQASAPPAV